ncbi:MAG TPA: FxsA family protein [Rhodothermales bacterium]|nr:FxsA family protein [Rhodothermales bacterium]
MKILARLFALFLIMPVVELALLVQVDKLIGFWPTIGIIVMTGLIGGFLAKREELSVWQRFNARMAEGGLPGTELLDGVIILVAGALLITPGVLTDFLGFLGLIPPTRALIRKIVMKRIRKAMKKGNISVVGFGGRETHPFYNAEANDQHEPAWEGNARDLPRHSDAPSDPPSDVQ